MRHPDAPRFSFRDKVACGIANFALNHVAGTTYRDLIAGLIRRGLDADRAQEVRLDEAKLTPVLSGRVREMVAKDRLDRATSALKQSFKYPDGLVDQTAERLTDIIVRASRIAESEGAPMTLSVLRELDDLR